jgi:hypothetical protein
LYCQKHRRTASLFDEKRKRRPDLRFFGAVIMITVALLLSGCDENPESADPSAAEFHTFTIENLTQDSPKQLTRLEVTPYGTVDTVSESLILNAGSNSQVKVAIPQTGHYTIQLYASDGQSIWWDNIELELPGASACAVRCSGSPATFWGTCAGVAEDGTDMTE